MLNTAVRSRSNSSSDLPQCRGLQRSSMRVTSMVCIPWPGRSQTGMDPGQQRHPRKPRAALTLPSSLPCLGTASLTSGNGKNCQVPKLPFDPPEQSGLSIFACQTASVSISEFVVCTPNELFHVFELYECRLLWIAVNRQHNFFQ